MGYSVKIKYAIVLSLLFCPIAKGQEILNGSSQYSLGADANTTVEKTTITVSCRVWLAANQVARQMVVDAGTNDGTTPGFGFGIDDTTNNKVKMYNANAAGTSNNNLVSNAALPLQTEVSVIWVMRSDGSGAVNKYIYINGELDNSVATTVQLGYESACRLGIGAWQPANLQFLNGRISHIKIWQRELSVNEIRTLGKCNVDLPCSKLDGCVTWNRLDEGKPGQIAAGTNVNYDLSGNGTNLTPTGSPIWRGSIMGYP